MFLFTRIKELVLLRLKPMILAASVLLLFFVMVNIGWAQLNMGPALIAPANGDIELSNPPNLGWCAIDTNGNSSFSFPRCDTANGINPGILYHVYMCDASAVPGCLPNLYRGDLTVGGVCNESTNFCIFTTDILEPPGTWFRWQIVADDGGHLEASEIRSFRVTVVPPVSITLDAVPTSQSITQGDGTSYSITATGFGVPAGTIINFGHSGCPFDATCALSAPSCTILVADGVCGVVYSVSNTLTVPGGNHSMVITGNAPPALSDSVIVDLFVTELADLTIAEDLLNPWPASVNLGDPVTFNFTTSNIGETNAAPFTDSLFIGGSPVGSQLGRSVNAGLSAPGSISWTATGCGLQNVYVRADVGNTILESNDEINGVDNNNSAVDQIIVTCPLPDYYISDLTLVDETPPFTVCPFDEIEIETTVSNDPTAGDAVQLSTARLYDNDVNALTNCELVPLNNTPALLAGQSFTYSCTWVASDTFPWDHLIESRADVPGNGVIAESDETNNTYLFPPTITVEPLPGTPLAPTFTNVTQNSLRVNWGFVSNATDYQVWRNGVQLNGTLPNTRNYYDDSGLTPGTTYNYWVTAINDCGAAIGASAQITTTFADLTIAQEPLNSWPTSVVEGTDVNLGFRTSNIGTAPANGFTDTIYIDSVEVYTRGLSLLPGANDINTSYTWTATGCGGADDHTIELRTDIPILTGGIVPESNESNNTHSHTIAITCNLLADLTIAPSAAWPTTVVEGASVNFGFRTTNSGTAPATNFYNAMYIGGTQVYTSPIPQTLPPGTSGNSGYTWTATGCPNTYDVYMETDILNFVPESNEMNNTGPTPVHTITVNCPPPPTQVLKGDLNCDGTVGVADLGIMASSCWWGNYYGGYGHPGCGTTAVPPCEPPPPPVPPELAVSLQPSGVQQIGSGQSVIYAVRASGGGSLTGNIDFTVPFCPTAANISCTFNNQSCQINTPNTSCSVQLTVETSSNTPGETYDFYVYGTHQQSGVFGRATVSLDVFGF